MPVYHEARIVEAALGHLELCRRARANSRGAHRLLFSRSHRVEMSEAETGAGAEPGVRRFFRSAVEAW